MYLRLHLPQDNLTETPTSAFPIGASFDLSLWTFLFCFLVITAVDWFFPMIFEVLKLPSECRLDLSLFYTPSLKPIIYKVKSIVLFLSFFSPGLSCCWYPNNELPLSLSTIEIEPPSISRTCGRAGAH